LFWSSGTVWPKVGCCSAPLIIMFCAVAAEGIND
jgi:hypothetical protein